MEFRQVTYPSIIDGMYSISEYGDVYNNQTNRILKPFISKKHNKYFILKLKYCDNDIIGYKNFRINRLVAWEFCENRDVNKIVMHLDNDKTNNYFKNLKWGTIGENTRDAVEDGLMKYNKPLYSTELIEFICSSMEQGKSNSEILKMLCGDDATMRKFKPTWYLIYHLRCKDRYTDIAMQYDYLPLVRLNSIEKDIIRYMIDGFENIDILKIYGYDKIKNNGKLYYMILRCRKVMKICSTTRERNMLLNIISY